ncbi:uncharacterized protein ABDE67_020516 [Symphorus nematophorus]
METRLKESEIRLKESENQILEQKNKGWHDGRMARQAAVYKNQTFTCSVRQGDTETEGEEIILQQIITFNICMSFTMKMLAVSVLVIAMMALTRGVSAAAVSEEAAIYAKAVNTGSPPTETHEEDEPETESDEDDTEDDTDSTTDEGEHMVAKRAVRCPCYWTLFRGRCYRYFPGARTWAQAQRHCQQMGANLASVHNRYEDNWIKRFVRFRPTWVGFSDAQQERFWFWDDGTRYTYANWCRGEPSDRCHIENCLQINWTGRKCWDDVHCWYRKGYVCALR